MSLEFVSGDELGFLLDFNEDVTGYSFQAVVYEYSTTVTFASPAGTTTPGAVVATFLITVIDASTGQLNLSLSETQTASLLTSKKYRWFLRWITGAGVTRTVLSGEVTASAP
jgi:hypothetical protein